MFFCKEIIFKMENVRLDRLKFACNFTLMRTYSRALSALFLLSTLCSTSSHAVIQEDALTLWYTFNEIENGTTVPDQTSNQLDATIHDDPVLVDAQYGKAMEFDGDLDKLTLAYTPLIALPEYTVSIWMKSEQANDNYVGIFGRGGRHYALYITPGHTGAPWAVHNRFRDGPNGNDGPPNLGAANHGEWVLLTVTKDMTRCSTYINGQFLGSGNVDYPYYGNRTNLNIAANPDNGNGQYYMGLYNIALTDQEVSLLFNDGDGDWNDVPELTLLGDPLIKFEQGAAFTDPGVTANDTEDGALTPIVVISPPPAVGRPPVAWWKFDDDATDATANSNDGTVVGEATFEDGKFGKALSLDSDDGSPDRVEIQGITGFAGDSGISISAWVNLVSVGSDDATGDGAIFGSTNANTSLLWINFDADPDTGKPAGERTSLTMNVGDTAGNNRVNAPGGLLSPGTWQHMVGVMDGDTRKVYIDGQLQATLNNAAESVHQTEGQNAWIGGWSGSANMDFDGMIDDVRVYDYPLSEEKITKLHTWDGVEDLELAPWVWTRMFWGIG